MVVLIAPLGFTPKLALAPLRDHDVEEVHLIYGLPLKGEGKEAVEKARATVETLGIPLREHGVEDAFDYEAILEAFEAAHAEAGGREVIVNGSGGTRPMIMATTIFAYARDLPLLYYDDYDTKQGKVIPLKAFRKLPQLGDSQNAILERLARGEADMGTLSEELGLAASTLTGHIQRMQASGLVSVRREGKRRVVAATPEVLRMRGKRPVRPHPSMQLLRRHRKQIMEICKRHHVRSVQVFGSVARGQAGAGSDVDLLVEPEDDFTLFDHVRLQRELAEVLGLRVDVVSVGALRGPMKERVLGEATAL